MEHQLDLFDALYEDFKFDTNKPLRVVELFSGIGFQSMGMELAEIPYEVVAISEIDKFAILAYASIHTDYLKIRDDYDFQLSKEEMVEILQRKNVDVRPSTNIERVKDFWLADKLSNNLGDISLLTGDDFPKNIDVMTYSFPCQDLSKAGQQSGLGKGTRSGLVYEVLRILQELKEINNLPKMPIMENVVDLVQAKFVKQWQGIQQEIEKIGYVNYQQTLNAKEYGIAQNRDRVFMVSLLGDYNYNFPKPFELKYRLKNYLEEEVDDKYYLSDAMYGYLTSEHEKFSRKEVFERNIKGKEEDIAATITTRETNVPTSTFIDMDLVEEDNYLLIPEATTRGYKEAYDGDGVYINRPHQKRGVVQDGMIQTLKTSGNDVGVVVNDIPVCLNSKVDGKQPSLQDRIYDSDAIATAVTTSFHPSYTEPTMTTSENDVGVVDAKKELCNKIIEQGLVEEMDMIRHSYTSNRMENLARKESENNMSATITTRADTLGVVVETDAGVVENRFFSQALETLAENDVEYGDSISAYNKKVDRSGTSPTITTRPEGLKTAILPVTQSLRIRKLTPRETGRLMGMNDNHIDRQEKTTSNAQMYKQHGNGIVAQVIGLIIGMAYYDDENELREKVITNSHMWIK